MAQDDDIKLMGKAPDTTLNPHGHISPAVPANTSTPEPGSWKDGWHETAHVNTAQPTTAQAERELEEFTKKAKDGIPSQIQRFAYDSTLHEPFRPAFSNLMSPEELATTTSAGHITTAVVSNAAHTATSLTTPSPLSTSTHAPVLTAAHPATHPNVAAAHHIVQLSTSDGKTMIEPEIEGQHHNLIADIAKSVSHIFHPEGDKHKTKLADQPRILTLTAAQAKIIGPIFYKLASSEIGPHQDVLSAEKLQYAADHNPAIKKDFAKAGLAKGVAYYTAVPAKALPNNLIANNKETTR